MYEVIADTDRARWFYTAIVHDRPLAVAGICLLKDGETIAAVLYDNWNDRNIFMHVAALPGRKWLNRWFLHETFKYPFVTIGASRVTGWVEADNLDAIKFDEHLGFRREAVLKGAGSCGQDVFLYVMTREECRYA